MWLHQKCDIHVSNNLAFFKSVEETSYKRSTFIVFSLSILFNLFAFQKQNQKPSPRKRKGKFFRMKLRWSGREKIMRNKISDPMGMKKHYSIQTIVLLLKIELICIFARMDQPIWDTVHQQTWQNVYGLVFSVRFFSCFIPKYVNWKAGLNEDERWCELAVARSWSCIL